MKAKKGILRLGTSGVVVPGGKQTFPDEFKDKSRLGYYSSLFNTVEINSTFKKLPKTSTVQRWTEEVVDHFQFTIKLWKEITHIKQLNIDVDNINTFYNTINNVGSKKGCLLVQFPGSIESDYRDKVEQILQRLTQLDEHSEWLKAIEFRHESWYHEETFQLIKTYHSSIVLQDMPKSNNLDMIQSFPFYYFRYHGPKGDYRGSYTNEFLEKQAEKISKVLNEGSDVYVYFNNTMGDAYNNAMQLKQMVTDK